MYNSSPITGVTAETTSPIDCEFGNSNLCSWGQSNADDFDWMLKTGSTSSIDTGPSNDHTGSTYTEGINRPPSVNLKSLVH